MYFSLIVGVVSLFIMLGYAGRVMVEKLEGKSRLSRLECVLLGCVVLFLRGQTPFWGEEFQQVIGVSLEPDSTALQTHLRMGPRVAAIGMSWTLLLGYPSYCFCEHFGAPFGAFCGLVCHLVAYLGLNDAGFFGLQFSVLLFAMSHTLLFQSHMSLSYLFPENAFWIVCLLGVSRKLSVYGPWRFPKLSGDQTSLELCGVLLVNTFCLVCALLTLPRAEILKHVMCVTPHTCKQPSDGTPFSKDPKQEGYVKRPRHLAQWVGRTWRGLRRVFLVGFVGGSTTVEDLNGHVYRDEGQKAAVRCTGKRNRVDRMDCPFMWESPCGDRLGFAKGGRKGWGEADEPGCKMDRSSDSGHEAQGRVVHPVCYPEKPGHWGIFFLLIGYHMLSLFRQKYLMFEVQHSYGVLGMSRVGLRQSLEKSGARGGVYTYVWALGSTGFFYWSVLYSRYGLIPYMLCSNFTCFLALVCLYCSTLWVHRLFFLFFIIYDASVCGFPLAAYGSVWNWSPHHISFVAQVFMSTGLTSLLCDVLLLFNLNFRINHSGFGLGFFLIMTGVGFAAPLILHLLNVHDSPTKVHRQGILQERPFDTAPHGIYASPKGFPKEHWLHDLGRDRPFIPLFQYFHVPSLLHLTHPT